jgi:predicted nucleic acid-binding protein
MLTSPDGPVVASTRTLQALLAIRKEKLLPQLYGPITIAQSNFDELGDGSGSGGGSGGATGEGFSDAPKWLEIVADAPAQELPSRIAHVDPSPAATLRLALSIPASIVLLEEPAKEKAKLSYIKAEGALSILVQAHRLGKLSAVQPMVKAWQALGFDDVLPTREMLDALWEALDKLE